MNVLGIDPGNKGALVLITNKDKHISILEYSYMPVLITKVNKKSKTTLDINTLRGLLSKWVFTHGIDQVLIEHQIVISGQGISSSSKNMYNYGLISGLCIGLDINTIQISSKDWQSQIPNNLVIDKDIEVLSIEEQKKRSVTYCKQLFPSLNLYRTNRCTNPSDGLSDAALISNYFFYSKNSSDI